MVCRHQYVGATVRPRAFYPQMTNNSRVFHVKRGFSLKFKQVQKAIEQNCSFVWVEYGRTFRDATPAEAISMRNQLAKEAERLESSEIPGVTFKPPIGAQAAHYIERQRAFEANQFYTLAVQ